MSARSRLPVASSPEQLVDAVIEAGVADERVLGALTAVPRARFVPRAERARAYADVPIPIAHFVPLVGRHGFEDTGGGARRPA